jgi:hypothetical protein
MNFPLIAPALAGDAATFPGLKNRHVSPRCIDRSCVMLGCLSCRQPLANLRQLHWHLEDHPEQTHVVAAECRERGWEAL